MSNIDAASRRWQKIGWVWMQRCLPMDALQSAFVQQLADVNRAMQINFASLG